jgi:plastin-3
LRLDSGHGEIHESEILDALEICGVKIPSYELRKRLKEKFNSPKTLTSQQFAKFADELIEEKNAEVKGWTKNIEKLENAYQVHSDANNGVDEIVHTIRVEEEVAFANWINSNVSHSCLLFLYSIILVA